MTRNLICIAALSLGASSFAWAQSSAVGLWKSIDDETGKPKSLVRITEHNGELRGRIEKLFRGPEEEQHPKCEKCEGSNKGQPVLGMTIISGMKQEGNEYGGGEILDPASGKVYKSKMQLLDDGKKITVRGYVGVPMFGRSQTWIRQE